LRATGQILNRVGRYNANLTKASLKVGETRILARALLRCESEADWKRAIVEENILHKRNPVTATTLAAVLRQRLEPLDVSMIEIISGGEGHEAALCILAGTLKQSALLRDFFDTTLGDLYRSFVQAIPPNAWAKFIECCEGRDPTISRWKPVVVRKLRQNVLRILAESGYIEDTRTLRLVRVQIPSSLASKLESLGEHDVLRLLSVGDL
jgi:hypothetical protein